MGFVSKVLRPFMRRENEVFAAILKYADEIALTASALRDMIGSLIGNLTRRKLSEEISKGGFFSNLRELLLELVERMDEIADYSKDAGRLLHTASSVGIDFSALLRSEPVQRLL